MIRVDVDGSTRSLYEVCVCSRAGGSVDGSFCIRTSPLFADELPPSPSTSCGVNGAVGAVRAVLLFSALACYFCPLLVEGEPSAVDGDLLLYTCLLC